MSQTLKTSPILLTGSRMAAIAASALLWTGIPSLAQPPASPPDPGLKAPPIRLTLTTDKKTYAAGEAIKIILTVKNATKQPIPLRFSSGQRYDFTLTSSAKPEDTKDAKIAWQWSRERMFTQMIASEKLEAGKSLTYTETLDTKGAAAPAKPLAAGKYTLTGTLTTMGSPRASATTTVIVK